MVSVVRGIILALLIVAAGAYIGDWLAYRMRGSPHASVRVSRFISVPLKNNKQEIDYLGSEDVLCAVTVFPQDGHAPCWYLRRHRNQISTY